MKRSSSMFISKTQRNAHQSLVKKSHQNPGLQKVGLGSEVNTIGHNVKKKVEQANNPIIAMITSKTNTTMAFTSNAPRFNGKVADEAETFLGPGYYDIKSTFETNNKRKENNQSAKLFMGGAQSNAVIAQMSQMGQVGLNARSAVNLVQGPNQRVFPPGSQKKAQVGETPGPGHYSQDNLTGWFKRSYNMNFSEI